MITGIFRILAKITKLLITERCSQWFQDENPFPLNFLLYVCGTYIDLAMFQ